MMKDLTKKELMEVSGGGLTLVEALVYAGSLIMSGGALPVTILSIAIIEIQDYKDGK